MKAFLVIEAKLFQMEQKEILLPLEVKVFFNIHKMFE